MNPPRRGGDLSGPVEMTAKSPNKMRALVRLDLTPLGATGEMAIDQLFDGTTGWISNSMQGDAPMSGDQLEGAKNAYFPPTDYKAVDGIQVAFTIYQSAGGQNVTMKFTKIENNVAVDDAVFIKK